MEANSSLQEEIQNLSHEDLCEVTQSGLRRLIAADPLLQDLPGDATVDEVLSQIAVAQGKSITVTVLRHSESPLNVVIPQQGASVRDLKRAIQRNFSLRQQRLRSKTKISWKYVWRTYDLGHWGKPMRKDNELVSKYGVVNKSEIKFYKKLNRKGLVEFDDDDDDMNETKQIARQELVSSGCRDINNNTASVDYAGLDHILVDDNHELLYCYVPKVACTNWKRLFMVLTGTSPTSNLMEIPGYLAHADNSTIRLSSLPPLNAKLCLDNYVTFLLVRHPFERLLSAYRNKFEDTYSGYFQRRYGRQIIEKYRKNPSKNDLEYGANVSFREFVKYLIDGGVLDNEHWMPIYHLCQPCDVNYNFIGKYETLTEDSRTLLDMVGASNVSLPQTKIANTFFKLRHYYQQLSIGEMQRLFRLYEMDFKLFGYNLENLLGFDLA